MASSPADVTAFFAAHFPHGLDFGFEIVTVSDTGATLRLVVRPEHLRPGQTLSGPTLMTLSDTAMYVALLGSQGPERGGGAVTTSLEVHFLRRPRARELRAECRLLKVGRRLAVGAVELFADDEPAPVAFSTVTYGFP
jgi:uncharacterized protein (TIGR00369 family)